MKVLVACEFSGIVRDAFIEEGHEAVSCDLLPSERPGPHIQDDVLKHLADGWDAMIAHPPCTYLAVSGARWLYTKTRLGRWPNKERFRKQTEAVDFVKKLWDAPISKVAIENPIGMLSTLWRKPDQIVQPWQFGVPELKATCFWIRGFPLLVPSEITNERHPRVHLEPPSANRWKNRSRTPIKMAQAIAFQWGTELVPTSSAIRTEGA
jgi:hypothetical protein